MIGIAAVVAAIVFSPLQCVRAADVTIAPMAGGGFVVKNAAGATDRLRVNEDGTVWIPVLATGSQQATPVCAGAGGIVGPCAPESGGGSLPAGTVNQTLRYDASSALVANSELQVFADGGVLATNAAVNAAVAGGALTGPGVIPASGPGRRLMWYPAKGALRAGYVDATEWDDANVGANSIALGGGTTASGTDSIALGGGAIASGAVAIAMGSSTLASGRFATAMGQGTKATGDFSTALGAVAKAQGDYSLAEGYYVNASGDYSLASGLRTDASGNTSTAMGYKSVASCQSGGEFAYRNRANVSDPAPSCNSTAFGAGSLATAYAATAMGLNTTASGASSTAMGNYSTATGSYSTAIGNAANASGFNSVAIGEDTTASGAASTAMGVFADTVSHAGSFVIGDGSGSTLSTADHQFMARASGGVIFYTSSAPNTTAGIQLAAGSGSWTALSDRNAKDAVTPVDPREVLAKVASMPLATWHYKTQDAKYRHMGPMAQDFYTAFHLGETDKGIDTIDADGVALAAIQGLDAENALLRERVARLEKQNADNDKLRERVAQLEAQEGDVAALKAVVESLPRVRVAPSIVTVAVQP